MDILKTECELIFEPTSYCLKIKTLKDQALQRYGY